MELTSEEFLNGGGVALVLLALMSALLFSGGLGIVVHCRAETMIGWNASGRTAAMTNASSFVSAAFPPRAAARRQYASPGNCCPHFMTSAFVAALVVFVLPSPFLGHTGCRPAFDHPSFVANSMTLEMSFQFPYVLGSPEMEGEKGESAGPFDAGVPYCTIFLVCSLLVWALELYIDLRQRRRLGEKLLPDELKKDFTQEEFTSACDYSIDKISFEMLSNTICTFAQALFFLMGGLAWLWGLSLSMLEVRGE